MRIALWDYGNYNIPHVTWKPENMETSGAIQFELKEWPARGASGMTQPRPKAWTFEAMMPKGRKNESVPPL